MVDTRAQMVEALDWLWHDDAARRRLGHSGAARVRAAHTCLHRAEQLLGIVARLRGQRAPDLAAAAALNGKYDLDAPPVSPAAAAAQNGHARLAPPDVAALCPPPAAGPKPAARPARKPAAEPAVPALTRSA